MAWTPPGAGELRDSVRFERRADLDGDGDGAGNFAADWRPLIARRSARLLPVRGGEAVQADRLAGTAAFELVVRRDPETAQVGPGDRAVDARDDSRVFNIRFAQDLEGRGRWIVMQAELGVAT